MPQLSVSDLQDIQKRFHVTNGQRRLHAPVRLFVQVGEKGLAAGARDLVRAAMDKLEASGSDQVLVMVAGDVAGGGQEPYVRVEAEGGATTWYGQVDQAKLERIFAQHCLGGQPVTEWVITEPSAQEASA